MSIGRAPVCVTPVESPVPAIAARFYDHLLGGARLRPEDRVALTALTRALPEAEAVARRHRGFVMRVVRWAAARGYDQFLDLGCGLPTLASVHEVARAHCPRARVAYVDIDRAVVAGQARAMATVDGVSVSLADLRRPHSVLSAPGVRTLLDPARPVVVLLAGVLHSVVRDEEAGALLRVYGAVSGPAGLVAVSHLTDDVADTALAARVRSAAQEYRRLVGPMRLRSAVELRRLVAGLDLVAPGVADVARWPGAAESPGSRTPDPTLLLAGCGRPLSRGRRSDD